MRAEPSQAAVDLSVFRNCEVKRHEYGDHLADDRSDCRSGNFKPRETEQSEDQDGIQDDVDDRAGSLGDHIVQGLSGRLHQSLEGNLEEYPGGTYGYNG